MVVCKNCGGTNIQFKAWVDANTLKFVDDAGDNDCEDNWCEDCIDHVYFCTKSEYLHNPKEDE